MSIRSELRAFFAELFTPSPADEDPYRFYVIAVAHLVLGVALAELGVGIVIAFVGLYLVYQVIRDHAANRDIWDSLLDTAFVGAGAWYGLTHDTGFAASIALAGVFVVMALRGLVR